MEQDSMEVFVSSVSRGLESARQELISYLRTADYDVINMEAFGGKFKGVFFRWGGYRGGGVTASSVGSV